MRSIPDFIDLVVKVNSHPARAFIDTGSTVNIISQRLASQLKLPIDTHHPINILQVDGNIKSIGRVSTQLSMGSQTHLITFHVLANFRYPLLLGLDVGKRFGLTVDLSTRKVTARIEQVKPSILNIETREDITLKKLLARHRQVFAQHDTDIGRIQVVKHKIITVPHPPIQLRPYRRPQHEYDEIVKIIREAEAKDSYAKAKTANGHSQLLWYQRKTVDNAYA
ncbi:uncharacterized protein LOC128963519 [Oppia nitens]|uniref:uncharacterized protein LOC128963519 n=1 Tax=Oppia nitens TaxID=1686743 RepID=UPI0023DC1645|nr:uncharacterized protein LOC128963519 [Oppia nitens]